MKARQIVESLEQQEQEIESFVQGLVDQHADDCHVAVSFAGNQIECRGPSMSRLEWVDFGKEIAREIERELGKSYYVRSAGNNMFGLYTHGPAERVI